MTARFTWHCANNDAHEPHGVTGDGYYGVDGYACNGKPRRKTAIHALWETWNVPTVTGESPGGPLPSVFDWAYLRGQKFLMRQRWPELADALDAMPEPSTDLIEFEPVNTHHERIREAEERRGDFEPPVYDLDPADYAGSGSPTSHTAPAQDTIKPGILTTPRIETTPDGAGIQIFEVYPHTICKNCQHAWRDHGLLRTSPNCFACERGAAWCSGFAR